MDQIGTIILSALILIFLVMSAKIIRDDIKYKRTWHLKYKDPDDPQVHLVYGWESACLNRDPIPEGQAYSLLRKLEQDYSVRASGLILLDKSRYLPYTNIIMLNCNRLDRQTVLHEFAHLLVNHMVPVDQVEPHGALFMGVLTTLMKQYQGYSDEFLTKTTNRWGISVGYFSPDDLFSSPQTIQLD